MPDAPPSALFDFVSPHPGAAPVRASFGEPLDVLVARGPGEVGAVLDQAQAHALAGRWCVGHVAFEAGAAFDPAFEFHGPPPELARFAIHEKPLETPGELLPFPGTGGWRLGPWRSNLDQAAFHEKIARIHEAIADGEVYQINFTTLLESEFQGDPLALFDALRRAQPGSYAAYLDTGAAKLLSVSPELFFDWRDGRILGRPMKGTAARGATPLEDRAMAQGLRESAKERAENLMIVDLIRNDLSRLAEPFSVQVPKLFDTHAWPTIWQMTSDVVARTRPGTGLADVFAALFPCGSVTGAPKVRAMHWIRRLEDRARGPYCGAIGILQPGGAATFNVAIRTVELQDGAARCGIGSGITADATADGAWRAWQSKQLFLQRCASPFELLETVRLQEGRYPLAEAHLARMAAAAAHFGYRWDGREARDALDALAAAHARGLWRVRLLCDAEGRFTAPAESLQDTPQPLRWFWFCVPSLTTHTDTLFQLSLSAIHLSPVFAGRSRPV